MASCCQKPGQLGAPSGLLTVALAGNPNSGKTTIFNALTGLRQKVANYPGVTVEKKTGRCKLPSGCWIDVIDLPGTYSLISRSPDEQIAMEVLRGLRPDTSAPDVVVVVVDASNLQRNLYLVSQLVEVGRPMVVALNMMDVARSRGIHVSPEALSRELGVPVVPVVGHRRQGIEELKAAILDARVAPLPDWPLPDVMKEELVAVGSGLAAIDARTAASSAPHDLNGPSQPRAWICGDDRARHLDRYQALAERLLIGDRAADVVPVASSEPVTSLLNEAHGRLLSLGIDPMQADIEAHYRWIEGVAGRSLATFDELAAMGSPATPKDAILDYRSLRDRNWTERIDSLLIHKIWGLVFFGLIMGLLFFSIFWIADPMMGAMESAVTWLGDLLTTRMSGGPLKSLITDGIFAGVGAVVVFVPQIALLFLFLAILEDSGYLARAAFLMDRLLAKVGLHGKSFIPLLSSFACAIPGIMATRTIENRKDRLATILVAPFMSCSARLPVYALLIGTFFATWSAWAQAGIMFSLYALGIIAAAGTAWIFKRSLLKGPTPAFILEMPTYKLPLLSQVARQVWINTTAFVIRAGTTIFCLSVILWGMTYYPRLPGGIDARRNEILIESMTRLRLDWAKLMTEAAQRNPGEGQSEITKPYVESAKVAEAIAADSSLSNSQKLDRLWSLFEDSIPRVRELIEDSADQTVAGEQLRHSVAGRLGHVLEPIIKPLGYDWKMGVGLVGAFAAREVFVSTMGIVYSVGDDDEETEPLSQAMLSDVKPDGTPVWTPLVAVSLLVWFVLAMQCMSTLAIVRRETGGWGWPLFMLLYMNGLAYVLCLLIYQVGLTMGYA